LSFLSLGSKEGPSVVEFKFEFLCILTMHPYIQVGCCLIIVMLSTGIEY